MELEANCEFFLDRPPAIGMWTARRCLLAFVLLGGGCKETVDASYNRPNGLLPVDQRNPVILVQRRRLR